MRKVSLALGLLVWSHFAVGQSQTPAYTQSQSFGCNQEVCNGLPLDQGGHWQFIHANNTFSLYHTDASGNIIFGIFGYPGNPGTGGITNWQSEIPAPPSYPNGASGGEGLVTFNFSAVYYNNTSIHYNGHVVVLGHQVRHCWIHGCWDQMIVDNAQIYIDSVTQN